MLVRHACVSRARSSGGNGGRSSTSSQRAPPSPSPRSPAKNTSCSSSEIPEHLVGQARDGDATALTEAYTFGWGPQAQAALHGELLRTLGARWDDPALAEAGRRVEQVAHRWTPLRVTAAHGHAEPRRHAADLARHARELHTAYARAVAAVEESM